MQQALNITRTERPRKWWSDLVIVQNGQEVSSKRILVNDPMDYGGIRIFQSSFGSSGNPLEFVLTLKDQSGSVPLSVTLRPGETLPLEGEWPIVACTAVPS